MIYCLNAVSELSQYFSLTLIQSGTQIREGAHVPGRPVHPERNSCQGVAIRFSAWHFVSG